MTTANTFDFTTGRSTRIATILSGWKTDILARWSLYRTRRILSGLDEHTLKDIGAPVPGGAVSSADPRVLRHLETLR